MGFRLRGGRPKNMGQGVYWTQRHLADQRATARANARIEAANASTAAFNERYSRILRNVKTYFDDAGEITVGAADRDRIAVASDTFSALQSAIASDIEGATKTDLNKLATAAKNLISLFGKAKGEAAKWDRSTMMLVMDGRGFEF